jgi:ABC-2 type transport system ATP-binding protein
MRESNGGPAIETSGLVKTFGETRALDGVDLRVPAGGVYGLLGPNGAGKTTTVKVVATLLRPDGGQARVFGRDVVADADEVRGRVSLTGQFASIDEDLTGTENLLLMGRLLGHGKRGSRDRAEQLLEAFGLTEAAGRQAKNYSGGMRRRLDIAASIINTPDLLVLDEPTNGLDPRSRSQVWDVIRRVVDHGTTVLLTTQYLEEADRLAGRIAVVDHGRVIAEGTPGELKASVGAGTVHVRLRDPGQRGEAERLLCSVLDSRAIPSSDPGEVSVRVGGSSADDDAAARTSRALGDLAARGIAIDHFSLGQPSLDEVFLALTDQPARSARTAKEAVA